MTEPTKPRYYKGRGEHSVMNLEHLVEQFIDEDIEMQTKVQILTLRVKELEAGNFRKILDQEKAYLQDALNAERAANAELSRKLAKMEQQRNHQIDLRISGNTAKGARSFLINSTIKALDAELNGVK